MSEYMRGRSADVGFAPSVAQRPHREPTPEEKAHAAEGVATNLERTYTHVVESIEALARAHDAHDVAGYAKARDQAEQAVARVQELARVGAERAVDASDTTVRAKLEQATALASVAAQNLAAAPGAPAPLAPTLRNESALLAALPPLQTTAQTRHLFDVARRDVPRVLRQMPFSDFAALEMMMRDFPEHEIVRRFRRFTADTQRSLLAILKDPTTRARARAIEATMPALVAPPAAFASTKTSVELVAPPPAFAPPIEIEEAASRPEHARSDIADSSAPPSSPALQAPALGTATSSPADVFRVPLVNSNAAAPSPTISMEPPSMLAMTLDEGTWKNDPFHRPAPPPRVALQAFLDRQSNEVWNAISAHLHASAWDVDPTERLRWDPALFVETLVHALHDGVMQTSKRSDISIERLEALLTSVDVVGALTPFLPLVENDDNLELSRAWAPPFGVRCGQLLQTALAPSVRRMITRYTSAADARGAITVSTPEELIVSSWLDRFVSRALVTSVSEVTATATPTTSVPTTLRPVTLRWEGTRDPRLWNWVRADRSDATPEEVAAAVSARLATQGREERCFADQLAAAPPLFGLPAHLAAIIPDARATSPLLAQLSTYRPDAKDTVDQRFAVLAGTTAADAAAVEEAGPAVAAERDEVLRAIDDAQVQLGTLAALLVPWDLAGDVRTVAINLATRNNDLAAGSVENLHAFAAVAFAQRERLGRIIREVRRISGVVVPAPDHPFRSIVEIYGRAASLSQLSTVSEGMIERAASEEAALTIRALQANQLAAMQATEDLHASGGPDVVARDGEPAPREIVDRARVVENQLLAGQTVEPHDLERVQLQLQEVTLRGRLSTIGVRLEAIEHEVEGMLDTASGAVAASRKLETLPRMAAWLRDRVQAILAGLDADEARPQARRGDGDGIDPAPLDVATKRDALAHAQANLAVVQKDIALEEFLRQAYTEVHDQRIRAMIVGLALAIGLQIVTSGVASGASAFLGDMLVTAKGVQTVAALSTAARFGLGATEFAIDTGLYALGDHGINGTPLGESLATTAFLNGATRAITHGVQAVARPIENEIAAARAWNQALATEVGKLQGLEMRAGGRMELLGRIGSVASRGALSVGAHTALGLTLGSVVEKVKGALDDKHHASAAPGASGVLLQGASIAIGRLVHARVTQDAPALKELAHRAPGADTAELLALNTRLLEHATRAQSNEHGPAEHAEQALALLDELTLLAEKRLAVLDRLSTEPGHGGYTPEELAGHRQALDEMLGSLHEAPVLDTQLHLLGMHQLDGDALWSGTPRQIDDAIRRVTAADPDARVERDVDAVRIVTKERTYQLHEVVEHGPVDAEARQRTTPHEHDESNALRASEVDSSEVRATAAKNRPHAEEHAQSPEHATKAFDEYEAWHNADAQMRETATLKAGGVLEPAQRQHLADELRRQVPDIGLVDAVRAGEAKTVLSVVMPGGGDTGIKAMNDDLIGYAINSSQLIPERNRIIKTAFESQGFKVIDQGYKMTTLATELPASATGAGMQRALVQIDQQMQPLFLRVLDAGIAHFTAEKTRAAPSDANLPLYAKRIKKMMALREKVQADTKFRFDFQLGAADIKGDSYADILAAEMDASKAAIMARDASVTTGRTSGTDGRSIAYSQEEFLAFCRETVALKESLATAQLPYEGRAVDLFDAQGVLNHHLLRAIRKNKYTEMLDPAQQRTLATLKQYITRVNSFDYVKHFTGDEVTRQGGEVAEAAKLVRKLESGEPIDAATTAQIDALLARGVPQAGAASEAQFYNHAATLTDRIVVNADIRDMGLDLFDGYATTMVAVGRGETTDLAGASASASDGIVDYKRNAVEEFTSYYRDKLLPKARDLASRRENRIELLRALNAEENPTMLLGGDEITVSLGPVFDELGLVPDIVGVLTRPKVANARVAVTHTGAGDGMVEHAKAMQRSSNGHDRLKDRVEPLARRLDDAAGSLDEAREQQATALVERLTSMYTIERDGQDVLVDRDGIDVDWRVEESRANALIQASTATGGHR